MSTSRSDEGRGPRENSRARVLRQAKSPLAFYVLSLLTVEGFLLGAGKFFDLDSGWKIAALATGVVLFIGDVVVFTWLVVCHPTSLVFSAREHMRREELRYGHEGEEMTAQTLNSLPSRERPQEPPASAKKESSHA